MTDTMIIDDPLNPRAALPAPSIRAPLAAALGEVGIELVAMNRTRLRDGRIGLELRMRRGDADFAARFVHEAAEPETSVVEKIVDQAPRLFDAKEAEIRREQEQRRERREADARNGRERLAAAEAKRKRKQERNLRLAGRAP